MQPLSFRGQRPSSYNALDYLALNPGSMAPGQLSAENIARQAPDYQPQLLRLLDELEAPMLLLPRQTDSKWLSTIAFLTDLRFTDLQAVRLLMRTANATKARILVVNISENDLPEMEGKYASDYFAGKIAPAMKGLSVEFVDLGNKAGKLVLERTLQVYRVSLVMALRRRKELLYRLVS